MYIFYRNPQISKNILKILSETNPELTSKYKGNSLKYIIKYRSQGCKRIDKQDF